jgi:hypothetical protein
MIPVASDIYFIDTLILLMTHLSPQCWHQGPGTKNSASPRPCEHQTPTTIRSQTVRPVATKGNPDVAEESAMQGAQE